MSQQILQSIEGLSAFSDQRAQIFTAHPEKQCLLCGATITLYLCLELERCKKLPQKSCSAAFSCFQRSRNSCLTAELFVLLRRFRDCHSRFFFCRNHRFFDFSDFLRCFRTAFCHRNHFFCFYCFFGNRFFGSGLIGLAFLSDRLCLQNRTELPGFTPAPGEPLSMLRHKSSLSQ